MFNIFLLLLLPTWVYIFIYGESLRTFSILIVHDCSLFFLSCALFTPCILSIFYFSLYLFLTILRVTGIGLDSFILMPNCFRDEVISVSTSYIYHNELCVVSEIQRLRRVDTNTESWTQYIYHIRGH